MKLTDNIIIQLDISKFILYFFTEYYNYFKIKGVCEKALLGHEIFSKWYEVPAKWDET